MQDEELKHNFMQSINKEFEEVKLDEDIKLLNEEVKENW